MKRQTSIEPVIKWSGSKRSIASALARLLPKADRSFEPFLGGGALLPFYKSEHIFAGDIIRELIDLWCAIKCDPDAVATGYEQRWARLQNEGHTAYYDIRDHFNSTRDPVDLLFLSRTCVNGLIRFNKDGNFNNSLHHTRPGVHPTRLRKVLSSWSIWVKKVHFQSSDYRETLQQVKSGDFVFLDPPYIGTRGRYIPQQFNFEEFYKELERLNRIGARWLLTLDGQAGSRAYHSHIPNDLYKMGLRVQSGNSPFTRLMGASLDTVHESVYLNFESISITDLSTTQDTF